MTGVLTYILTFDKLPELDRAGRPKMFYGQRIHDKCYRRAFFDAGQFVEAWDDEGARKGWCLYKMGCRGPTTYNSCSTIKWNGGTCLPDRLRPPCIGCSEDELLGQRAVLPTLADVPMPGIDATPDKIGETLAVLTGAGVAAHLASQLRRSQETGKPDANTAGEVGVSHGNTSRSRSHHAH